MTLNDLERQFTAPSSELCMLWPNDWGKSHVVFAVLYLVYLYVKFEYEIWVNVFEFQTYFPIRLLPKLNCRLGVALFRAARFRIYCDF